MQMICIYTLLTIGLNLAPDLTWDRLAPLSALTQEQLLERLPEHTPEAKLIIISEAKGDESKAASVEDKDLALYQAYWLSQKKYLRYPGIFIAADKKLPGQFADRKWSDKHILIVETSTSRDVLVHLVLHFLLPEYKEWIKVSDEVIRLQTEEPGSHAALIKAKLQLFTLDIETLTDLYALEKTEGFKWSEAELESIVKRLESLLTHLERQLTFLKSTAKKHDVETSAADAFIKKIKDEISKHKKQPEKKDAP